MLQKLFTLTLVSSATMSLPDCKYRSNIQTDDAHSLHSLPMDGSYEKRSITTLFDFKNLNLPENLEVKWVHLFSPTKPRGISRVRVVSFLLCLALTFLIVVSYSLTWDRKGLLLTPSPYQLRPVVSPTIMTTTTADLSSVGNPIDMKLLVKTISSKLEYTPRKVPDEEDIIRTAPNLFSTIPQQFLPGIKSPCWHQDVSGRPSTDPYRGNIFTLRSENFKNVSDYLRTNFQQHLYHRQGRQYRLRCLPYFYIIGQPKCGTTDLYDRLLLHPEVKFNTMKEPHWWTRKRFGYIRFKAGFKRNVPVDDYLDLFDLAAHKIQEGISGNSSGHHSSTLQVITGEASASTMWDNQAWSYLHDDREETDPPFLTQDFIHKVQPDAKIIIMLRDPVERLYSDYLYFKMANKSTEDFHQKVTESLQLFKSCLSARSLRSCVYNTSLFNAMPVRLNLGMYIVFLLDWFTVFDRDQILALRLEDCAANLTVNIQKVFDFLNVGPVPKQVEAALTKRPMSNTRRLADRSLGPMLPATRDLLREFHQPFNHKLARVLNNKDFLWRNT